MSSKTRYLFVISFTVLKDSGLALVIAGSEREAIIILGNDGKYGRSKNKYSIIDTRNFGESCSCEYGLLMESYVDSMVAFDALCKVFDKLQVSGVSAAAIEEALGYMPAKVSVGTVVEWNSAVGYIPQKGEIVVYSDYGHRLVDGQMVNVPAIKIGSGNAYVQDLQFIGAEMVDHINDNLAHVSASDRLRWDGKLSINDEQEVVNGALVFNRN